MSGYGYRVVCDLCGMLWTNDPHAWLGPEPRPCRENAGGPHIPPEPEIVGDTWRDAKGEWLRRADEETP